MEQYKYRRALDDPEAPNVEAVQLTTENAAEVNAWCDGVQVVEHDAEDTSKTFPGINVGTFAGMKRASVGDFIIKDSMGEFHVRRAGIFDALYCSA